MFSSWFGKDVTPTLISEELMLRAPASVDYDEWRALRLTSRPFLKPFEPRWAESDLSRRIYNGRLARGRRESNAGTEFTFFIFTQPQNRARLVGGITLSNIRRRVAQHVNLGYWMGVDDAGKGTMTGAVATILPFVFNELVLHRIHAACLPDNLPSRRVLEKNLFKEEGYAPNYLQIDGSWRDHVLYGLTRERFHGTDVRT